MTVSGSITFEKLKVTSCVEAVLALFRRGLPPAAVPHIAVVVDESDTLRVRGRPIGNVERLRQRGELVGVHSRFKSSA